jgi:hypothetical protein
MSLRKTLVRVLGAVLAIVFLCAITTDFAQSQGAKQRSLTRVGQASIKVTSPSGRVVWVKGKKYGIRWESQGVQGEVRILLLREDVKASQTTEELRTSQAAKDMKVIEIVKSIPNSGSYDYVVPGGLPEGIYKVQVMTIDGSIMGTSEGTVAIRGLETRKYGLGDRRKGTEETKAVQTETTSKAAKTQAAGAAAAASATPSGGTTASKTPAKATTSSTGIGGKSQASAAKTQIVKLQVAPVKVSATELNKFEFKTPEFSASTPKTNLKIGGHSTAGGTIDVLLPHADDVWQIDQNYVIRWKSTGISGDVRIDLESTLTVGGNRKSYPIIERTADTGSYSFHVPANWFDHNVRNVRVRVSTLDGNGSGASPGSIKIYTQNVDLQCMIVEPGVWATDYHDFNPRFKSWFEFNVWFRNDGLQPRIMINTILFRLIKEPEEVVLLQEEWGTGWIYPGAWYKLAEPKRIDIYSSGFSGTKEYLGSGSYRVEVTLDPQNQLGEREPLRDDNKAVARWHIGKAK